MRKQISIAAAGLGLLGATLAAGAQAAANLAHNAPNETSSEPFFFYCLSGVIQNTVYLSPAKRSDAGVSRQNLEKSFYAFLAQAYKYPNSGGAISCPFLAAGSTQARTEADRQRIINNLHAGHY